MAATIVPLLSLNAFWAYSQRQSLINDTQSRQTLITQSDAERVNDFITEKVRNLIIHSQSPSLQQFNLAKASLEISTLLYQDKDLTRASLVDQNGQEVVALTSDLKSSPLQNVKNSDAFKVVNYFAANQYISPVTTGTNGQPTVTIAIPLVTFTTPQELGSLSTSEPGLVRNPQDIKGALIAQATLNNLWSTVLSTSNNANNKGTPVGGYAYVVDDKGSVIAYPDGSLANKDLSSVPIISLFKQNLGNASTTSGSVQGLSEKNVQVMATYQKVSSTDWGVIFEEPMSSVYHNVSHVSNLGLAISAAAIILMAALSLWLSRFISKPILSIAHVAERIGKGNFKERITMKRSDEIGALATSVNSMGTNLQEFIGRIEAQRRQLEIIINSTTDSIFAVDMEGKIIIANQAAAAFSERSITSLVGDKLHTLFPWTQESKPFNIDYDAAGTRTFYDLQYTSPSGVVHYVNLIVVKNNAQTGPLTIVTVHDETKSRELEDMKIDFVSMAAHELRTPLSTIRGYLELITYQPENGLDEKSRHYIAQARQSTEQLATLISNLLDVSRIERGTLVLTMDKVDLADSVKQTVQNLHFNAAAKNIGLTYAGPDREKYIIADSVALREVVGNLIDNAIKYTPAGGQVEVGLTQQDANYQITVKDTGIGIPANAIPYLFTKFYRVHGGLESGSNGTGLGLFIAKSIVERHGGTISVKSDDGNGSVFTVTIPIFSEEKFAEVRSVKGAENVNRRRGWTTKNIAR